MNAAILGQFCYYLEEYILLVSDDNFPDTDSVNSHWEISSTYNGEVIAEKNFII